MTSLASKTTTLAGALLILGSTLLTPITEAAVTQLDRVAVVVNDDIVMESQVRERVAEVTANYRQQQAPVPAEDVIRNQVIEMLIMDSIQLQTGERAGVRVDDNTLNQTMARIAAQNNMTLEQFEQQLQAEGSSYQETREKVRSEMIKTRVREGALGARIQITEQEIQNYLASEIGQKQLEAAYQLGHILLVVPEDASTEEQVNIKAKAQELLAQLESGADFAALAAAHSDGPAAAKGGDMGWRKESRLPSTFTEAVVELKPGEVSAPIRSANGYHLVKLLNKSGGDTLMVPETHIRHILIEITEIRNEEEAKAFTAELRQRILDGESFGELAETHSADTGSLASGGDLGWTSGRDFVPEFRNAMENAEINVLTEPVRSAYGWHLIEVLGRRTVDKGKEMQRGRAREALFQRKFDEELPIWLSEQRENTYVDIKTY